jgi:hypothetical protein
MPRINTHYTNTYIKMQVSSESSLDFPGTKTYQL